MLNIWPNIFGVMLYGYRKKIPLGNLANATLFTTGLAPITSELLLRYPNTEVIGFSFHGVVLALAAGLLIGYFLPVGLDNSPQIHKGMAIYSAALPVGMTAFFFQGLLYRGTGIEIPPAVGSDMTVESPIIVNTFCIIFFVSCIIFALLMGCTAKDYWKLLIDPKFITNFAKEYGPQVMMMNVGVYGLFILGYYNIIGASFNGATFGTILGMVTTVPNLHGGLCLYNGGFTAALVCLLLVPILERMFRTKHVRREHLKSKWRN